MPSNHVIPISSVFPSIRVFSNESVLCIRWPKYWSFSFNISPSNEYSGLISSRIDWLDLLAVQGTLKGLLQHHSSKKHQFFDAQLLYGPYMTTGKTIALTRWPFFGKVMSLLLNMLSKLVITFLPMSKHLLISWLQSPSAVILEPKKRKSDTVPIVSPIYLPWSDGIGCHDLSFLYSRVLSQLFHSPLSPSSRGSLVPLCFLPLPFIVFITLIYLSPRFLARFIRDTDDSTSNFLIASTLQLPSLHKGHKNLDY